MNTRPTSQETRDDERFLSEADLAEIERPDTEIVIPRAGDPINEAFRKVGATIAVSSLLIVWVLLLVAVVLRYATGSSMDFATELPAYLYPWIIAGGVIVAMALGGHIAVDFVLTRLGPRGAQGTQVGIWVFSGTLFAVITVLSLSLVEPLLAQITPILGWPRFGSFAAFMLMAACLAVQSFARAWSFARGRTDDVTADAVGAKEEVYGV
ncbi:TRAP transporter small permease subunit [Nesterenkonia xinjiangensis]|uniref:TRAP-type C4-dicarboxylate transport system permease small subunit n=1 Tax=Nesterenkonia xinjiangensis TaxID=225327 RepID=A0A7Z0GMD7_9MICC|nr:TRAP-type C4-dicarboxylate transport system permease small subunit [Nesterenkonia xinjiangensis]